MDEFSSANELDTRHYTPRKMKGTRRHSPSLEDSFEIDGDTSSDQYPATRRMRHKVGSHGEASPQLIEENHPSYPNAKPGTFSKKQARKHKDDFVEFHRLPTTFQYCMTYFIQKLAEVSCAYQFIPFIESSYEETKELLAMLLRHYTGELTPGAFNVGSQPSNPQLFRAGSMICRYRSDITRDFYRYVLWDYIDPDYWETDVADDFSARLISGALNNALCNLQIEADDDWDAIDPDIVEDLVACPPFEDMCLHLRKALSQDVTLNVSMARAQVLECLPLNTISDGALGPLDVKRKPVCAGTAHFKVRWDLYEFLSSQYGTDIPDLADVVILTGSTDCAQATTCGDYITTNWPSSGPVFLASLEGGLSKIRASEHTESSVYVETQIGQEILQAVCEETVDLAKDFHRHIGSAFGNSGNGHYLAHRTPLLTKEITLTHFVMFKIKFNTEPLRDTKAACWLTLFHGASIAFGFPTPARGDQVGLEISLKLLAQIIGSCHAVEFDGGVVMKGFSHMIVPVRKQGNLVQWHAITSSDPERRLTYGEGLSHCGSRLSLDELSLDDLAHCRAFVGWCSPAISKLGSKSANFEKIDYSGAENASSSLRCAGGTLGFQQWGVATLDFKLGAKDGTCHFQRNGPYQRVIYAAEQTPVLLYDRGMKCAWLVPASGVMLHIAQNRHRLDPYTFQTMPDTGIPPGSPAKDILLNNAHVQLSYSGDYQFKDLIVHIWSLLEYLLDQNVVRERNSAGTPVRGTPLEYLQGFEYKAVVEERSPFRLKETRIRKTHGGWPHLVHDIDALVLLADGFEDLIVPGDDTNTSLCRDWQRVPKGKDYLATSTAMLADLYDVAGCRLNRKYLTSTHLKWHQGDSLLFGQCADARTCRCNRLQQIVPKSALGTIRPPEHLVEDGAVIFGYSGGWMNSLRPSRRQDTPTQSTVYSQPNIPLESLVILNPAEETSCSENNSLNGSAMEASSMFERNLSGAAQSKQDVPESRDEYHRRSIVSQPCIGR